MNQVAIDMDEDKGVENFDMEYDSPFVQSRAQPQWR